MNTKTNIKTVIVILGLFLLKGSLYAQMGGFTSPLLWQQNLNDSSSIYYNDGYVGIGTKYPQSTLHLHSLKKKNSIINLDVLDNLPLDFSTESSDDGKKIVDDTYYSSTFQMTNKITDSTSTDGFLIDMRNKNILLSLKEEGFMYFYVNGKRALQISPQQNVFVGQRIRWTYANSYESKLSINTHYKKGALLINSNFSIKDDENAYLIKAVSFDNNKAFIIKNNGNVGIGTFDTQERLNVQGNLKLIKNNQYLTFSASNGGSPVPNSGTSVEIGSSTGVITFWSANNVGYNTIVAGKIWAKSEVAVSISYPWADYVFADNYKLIELKDLEKYIEKNKHLPEIPTASEVKQDGIKLGEMNAKLLKKVEELTLYIIKQSKQLEELERQVEEIKKQN